MFFSPHTFGTARACLQKAFCQMCVWLCDTIPTNVQCYDAHCQNDFSNMLVFSSCQTPMTAQCLAKVRCLLFYKNSGEEMAVWIVILF